MRNSNRLALIFATLTLLGCSAQTPETSPSQTAYEAGGLIQAELLDPDFERAGYASFSETESGMQATILLSSVPEGEYRAQLHEFGACEAPGFLSAGKPFYGDPSNSEAEHRFVVSAAGLGHAEFVVPRMTRDDILRPGGTAVVIEKLSAEGYGSRFACGVIRLATDGSIAAENLTPGGVSSGLEAGNLGTGDGKVHRRPADRATPRP